MRVRSARPAHRRARRDEDRPPMPLTRADGNADTEDSPSAQTDPSARIRTRVGGAVAGGLMMTAALPPFGWWLLAIVGAAALVASLDGVVGWDRAVVCYAAGLAFLVPGLWWMSEFTLPGYALAVLLEGLLIGLGLFAGRGRVALPAAVVLSEALRASWPFGGVPVPTVAQTQVGGPLMPAARLGGELLIAGLVVLAGVALVEALRRRWLPAGAGATTVVIVALLAAHAPRPKPAGSMTIAVVQGGGERGTRAIDTDEGVVFRRHLDASLRVARKPDLILWPENVVHVDQNVTRTPEGKQLARLARTLHATLVAGVVVSPRADRGQGSGAFLNLAEAWGPGGTHLGRYEKNRRVPFGEFIPFRSMVRHLADLGAVPRDARVGHGSGLLRTPAGSLGVVISWEVFFADRARDAVSSGGEVLLVPTNAASFSTSQMPALELAAARLRAVETGRDVAQAAPTGFSAVIDGNGNVMTRSALGKRVILDHALERRHGKTPYTTLGDGPFVIAALLLLLSSYLRPRVLRRH